MRGSGLIGCAICNACLVLVLAFAEENSTLMYDDNDAVSKLKQQLSEQGVRCGYSQESHTLVIISHAEWELSHPYANAKMFMAQRNSRFLTAELDARKSLITALKTHLQTRDASALAMKGEVNQVNKSTILLSAQKELMGCTVLRTCETYVNGIYQVGVAMQWSAQMSQATERTLCTSDGKKGSPGVKDEWFHWASQVDWSSMAGNRKFIDSEGLVRYVGIGCADVEGLELTSTWMRRAQDSALYQARANLSLALYADTISVEAVSRFYSELSDYLKDSSDSIEAYIGKITRHSDKRTAFAPEVYATFAVHPITKRKMFISVCGYEP